MLTNTSSAAKSIEIHPLVVRVTHWINVVAMFIMIGSGWRIYNDSPLFSWLHFSPAWSLGGDPDVAYSIWQNSASGALQWHFAGMWLLVINGLVFYAFGVFSGRFRRMLWPVTVSGVIDNVTQVLKLRLPPHEAGVYNHVQRLLYIGVLTAGVFVVLSGLVMWKPVQFQTLAILFWDFQGARLVHFACMSIFVLFVIVHVALALLVPRTLVSMVTGRATVDQEH